ncbi:hypothetical protein BKA93DRAFT_823279 [Sparassis latifolia]
MQQRRKGGLQKQQVKGLPASRRSSRLTSDIEPTSSEAKGLIGQPVDFIPAHDPAPIVDPVPVHFPAPVLDPVPAHVPVMHIDPVPMHDPAPVVDPVPAHVPAVHIDPVPTHVPAPVLDPVPAHVPAMRIDPVPAHLSAPVGLVLAHAPSVHVDSVSASVLAQVPALVVDPIPVSVVNPVPARAPAVLNDDMLPPWLQKALGHLRTLKGVSGWEDILVLLVMLEHRSGYPKKKARYSKDIYKYRPDALSAWMGYGRKFNSLPHGMGKASEMRVGFHEWWAALQPAARAASEWPFSQDRDALRGTWGTIAQAGDLGFFLIVMYLWWWASVLDNDNKQRQFSEALSDVRWMLEGIVQDLEAGASDITAGSISSKRKSETPPACAAKRAKQ